MKTACSISVIAVTVATWLVAVSPGEAGEYTYLETFETRVAPEDATMRTSVSNGVLSAWATFAPHNPTNLAQSMKTLGRFGSPGDIRPGQQLEARVDVLRVSGQGAYVALGWSDHGIPGIGYCLLLNTQEIALVKHRFDQQVFAPFFWQPLPVNGQPMTVVLRFDMGEGVLSLQTQVLEQETGQVIFERTVDDSPGIEAIVAEPAPPHGVTPDPGPPWPALQSWGWLELSLWGAITNRARLEMEVDNLGIRQTLEVTAEDAVARIYTNAAGATLPYRLFLPNNIQPDSRYPLVLFLHGGRGLGDDNVRQLYDPGLPIFALPHNQARHPCFLAAPQLPVGVDPAYPDFPWWSVRDRVMGLLATLQTEHPIDPDRIYLIGWSLGGTGTWMLAAEYSDVFAAAVPCCGLGVTEQMNRLVSMPVWAFHGAKDSIYPVDGSWPGIYFSRLGTVTVKGARGAVADLRRAGGCPIYTEYAQAGHGIAVALNTPGLVDWVMAQRRRQAARQSPWIAITAPASDNTWTTSYTNLDLTGTACADAGITNVVWRNETLYQSRPATGTTNWFAMSIPLRSGRILGTDIVPTTNIVNVTATGTSWCGLYGGATTFNAPLRAGQIPIRLQSSVGGHQVYLEWIGVAPSFVVQRATDLGLAEWVDLTSTSQTNLVVTPSGSPEFYRIKLP